MVLVFFRTFQVKELEQLNQQISSSGDPIKILLLSTGLISLVGTTALGFNLFLGGVMAKGKAIGEMQRGITFSTVAALCVSVLILIVGAGMQNKKSDDSFTIAQLSDFLAEFVGQAGVVVFAKGFLGAALSTMLAVPLGVALTANSIFSDEDKEVEKASVEDLIELKGQKLSRKIYLAIMFIIVIIATIVIAMDGEFG